MVDKGIQYDSHEPLPQLRSPVKEVQTEPFEPAPQTPAYAPPPVAAVSQSSEESGESRAAPQAPPVRPRNVSPSPCAVIWVPWAAVPASAPLPTSIGSRHGFLHVGVCLV